MPTKAELLERVRELEEKNAILSLVLTVLAEQGAKRRPTGPEVNKRLSERAKKEMREIYQAGRNRHGMNKTKARRFANDMEKILGFNKLGGYSPRWLIDNLKD